MWLIRRKGQRNDYWNNGIGWVSLDEATIFDDLEKQRLNLPFEGYWAPIKKKRT